MKLLEAVLVFVVSMDLIFSFEINLSAFLLLWHGV